jgi:hypothetical protein
MCPVVIIQATDSYFGFDLLNEVDQACIFALIYTKATDFVNGWMLSKVMPQWVLSYSDWLAFEKQVGKVYSGDQNQLWKIPQSVSYFGEVYTDEDKSSHRHIEQMNRVKLQPAIAIIIPVELT